jgi:hypothetical protein
VFEADLRCDSFIFVACTKLQCYMGHVCPILEDVAVKDLMRKRGELSLQ